MTQLINSALLDRFKDAPGLVHRLIQVYLQLSPTMISEIETANANGDIEEVGRLAHSLKGSSAELGAENLADVSHRLQIAAKSGTVALIDPLISELKDCHGKTIVALNKMDPGQA